MHRTSFCVVLLAMIGLAGGFLFMQNSMMYQQEASFYVEDGSLPRTASVADTLDRAETRLREELESDDEADSQSSMVSSRNSLMLSSEKTSALRFAQAFSITGLTAKPCNVHIAVFESAAAFPKSELSSQTIIVSSTKDQIHITLDLQRNQPVAVAVFQDIDGNGSLSRNTMGAPTEPYGFSNNARGLLGPPAFEQAALTFNHDRDLSEPIKIRVR